MFQRITPIVKNLLLLNVGIFLLQLLLGGIDLVELGGLRYVRSDEFAPYQFISYMFLHAGWWHLFSNMFALFMFGPLLEQFWGAKRFLIFYLVTGVGAGFLYSVVHFFELYRMEMDATEYLNNSNYESFYAFISNHAENYMGMFYSFITNFGDNPHDAHLISESRVHVVKIYNQFADNPMIGASGAVFGILMAFGMLFPNIELMLLFPPIPIKAKYFVLIYGGFELYQGVHSVPGDNIAHFAHLGGMLIAFIMIRMWGRSHNRFY